MSNDKLAEALEVARNGLLWYQDRYPNEVNGCDDEAMATIDAALQAHAADAAHPQPAQDASKYQELLMAVEKKFPGESRHETALRYIRETELQSCEPKCDAAMAKASGR